MIKITDLTKWYGSKLAVDHLSFEVNKGDILGFIGPNGAGKSTTMRMITGFIPPSSGSISVGDYDAIQSPLQAKSLIGYLPENAPLYSNMTVSGFLNFCAAARGLKGKEKKAAVDKAINQCFLEKVRHQTVDTLSKGFRHRTCLAQSILNDPPILILDEPTDGLDPNQKHQVRQLITHLGKDRVVILSTHILEEVESCCNRVITINQGQLVFDGSPADLRKKAPKAGCVIMKIYQHSPLETAPKIALHPEVVRTETVDASTLRIFPKNDAELLSRELFQLCLREQWQIQELYIQKGRLDEVFRHITAQPMEESAK